MALVNEPDSLRADLAPLPSGVTIRTHVRSRCDVAVVFLTQRAELERRLAALTNAIAPAGALWIAWPKKAAVARLNLVSDMSEDIVRAVALPTGLVDNKVCAIDDIWSGLRLVVRVALR